MNPSLKTALWRGLTCRCPRCGKGRIFARFTTVSPVCSQCGLDFTHHRADDAPPYVIILVLGHILVPLAILVEKLYHPPLFVHWLLWLPLAIGLSVGLLPPVKGLIIAIQWANEMHGFKRSS